MKRLESKKPHRATSRPPHSPVSTSNVWLLSPVPTLPADPSVPRAQQYIGSLISLVSKSDVRPFDCLSSPVLNQLASPFADPLPGCAPVPSPTATQDGSADHPERAGILHSINPAEATVSLEKGSFGFVSAQEIGRTDGEAGVMTGRAPRGTDPLERRAWLAAAEGQASEQGL